MVFEVASFSLKADDGNQYDVFSKKPLSHGAELCHIYLKTCHQIVCAVGKDFVNALHRVSRQENEFIRFRSSDRGIHGDGPLRATHFPGFVAFDDNLPSNASFAGALLC